MPVVNYIRPYCDQSGSFKRFGGPFAPLAGKKARTAPPTHVANRLGGPGQAATEAYGAKMLSLSQNQKCRDLTMMDQHSTKEKSRAKSKYKGKEGVQNPDNLADIICKFFQTFIVSLL